MAGGHGGGGGGKAVVAAFFANLGIAIAKFIGFLFTGSSSMLAESVHSVADTGNQALLLLGARRARRPSTAEHAFGHGRERYFWAFVVALVLFIGGAAFAIYEGIEKIRHPHELESAGWAIGILAVAIVLEIGSFRVAIREANHVRAGKGWVRFVRTSRTPELPVVLLEDLGALVGLVLALLGVVLTVVTDEPVFDGIGTLCIGVLLAVIAVTLAAEMKSLLIGESALPEDEAAISAALCAAPEVRSLIHLRTQHIGPEELLVAAKLEFAPHLDVAELAGAVDAAEARVRARVPFARLMFLEPDLRRPTAAVAAAPGDGPFGAGGPAEPAGSLEPELPHSH
jgi:cation diffusion facilitator family transporter